MIEDNLNYPYLIDQAMRGVVRDILRRVEKTGLPGNHHFFISYSTLHPAVKMSEQLRAKYPKEITIVMQHQFWDFKVDDNQFNVTLSFSGVPEKLTVPFAALTAFADPSIKFGLQFQSLETSAPEPIPAVTSAEGKKPATPKSDAKSENSDDDDEDGEKIISLDSFRKK